MSNNAPAPPVPPLCSSLFLSVTFFISISLRYFCLPISVAHSLCLSGIIEEYVGKAWHLSPVQGHVLATHIILYFGKKNEFCFKKDFCFKMIFILKQYSFQYDFHFITVFCFKTMFVLNDFCFKRFSF